MTTPTRRALARCQRERRKACRYLRKGGPEALDALMGWADWTIEMSYIRTGRAEFGDATRPARDTQESASCLSSLSPSSTTPRLS
jgi:hypothetical protein